MDVLYILFISARGWVYCDKSFVFVTFSLIFWLKKGMIYVKLGLPTMLHAHAASV